MAHRRLAALAAAITLGPQAVEAASLVLPVDNLRTTFREDPVTFAQQWPPPMLTSGKSPTIEEPTDVSLHSSRNDPWASILYPSEWEKSFDGARITALCREWWWLSYVASSLYLVGLWAGTNAMRERKPFDLKSLLAAWNLFLAVFSFFGALRTLPHLFAMLQHGGFNYTLCRAALGGYGSGPTGLWVSLFIFSKYFELIDTVFLVVRKKKVGFLHWYHHCSVLLYCWHAYVWEMPTGIYFVVMNYSVHAIMYFYYFLAAVCRQPPKWALMVTIMQLVQMAIGIIITLSHLHILFYSTVPNCDGHVPNLTAALGMYASYFILFAQFLFGRYCKKRDPKAHKLQEKLK
mmetsp:Transcript_9193/g.20483  ORF Transcript_9193/g.20483 Transcript_9193/m.20483 type:complete len:347 (-) Transcript_9193:135-1175(-)|eukprot:CAMPEP_0178424482 /NCGR_PEP_ID=MMETSP0689_2-20121128/28232_1 /TAXON_ID=160604 /ORGANISM="Amphidinium massartii, Strain CS-259" /LENGTH=346 /DNA_ID=CAMNT_0020046119 /DNA_START=63 /DNA_END=1103 /DNA_ORIENTATION=+